MLMDFPLNVMQLEVCSKNIFETVESFPFLEKGLFCEIENHIITLIRLMNLSFRNLFAIGFRCFSIRNLTGKLLGNSC